MLYNTNLFKINRTQPCGAIPRRCRSSFVVQSKQNKTKQTRVVYLSAADKSTVVSGGVNSSGTGAVHVTPSSLMSMYAWTRYGGLFMFIGTVAIHIITQVVRILGDNFIKDWTADSYNKS